VTFGCRIHCAAAVSHNVKCSMSQSADRSQHGKEIL